MLFNACQETVPPCGCLLTLVLLLYEYVLSMDVESFFVGLYFDSDVRKFRTQGPDFQKILGQT